MPTVGANGIELYFERFGEPTGVPILLISGLGAHCTGYDDEFCALLGRTGLPVVRYDNRDVGWSTHLPGVNYLLEDMARDALGLLDALDIATVHVVGTSMGGMIGQLLAIDHPGRVLTLTSIMSSTGEPHVGQARPEVLAAVIGAPPQAESPHDAVERGMRTARVIGSPDLDEDYHRRRQQSFVERGIDPGGVARQAVAVVSSADRAAGLARMEVPTLVIHGACDPLVDISGGRRTAELVAGSRFVEVAGMGHDLPPRVWPLVVDEIATHILTTRAIPADGRKEAS